MSAAVDGHGPSGSSVARLVILHSSDDMYGADRMLLHVVSTLEELGDVEVEVWLPDDVSPGAHALSHELSVRNVTWSHRSIPVLRRAYLRPRGLFGIARRAWVLRHDLAARDFDAVYLATSACLLAAPIARLAGIRSRILHVQELWTGPEGRVLRWLARWTTLRIAISRVVADRTGLRGPDPVVVENCVDDPGAPEPPTGEDPGRDLRFLVASRWNRWKGHRTLLLAWEAAGCPGRLVVLGGPPAVGDSVDVARLVDELVSRPRSIEIVGEVPDIAPYIRDSDIVLVPSDEPEPFGLVVIEAFAAGRPVIASRGGGPLEIIRDGHDGWLFGRGDHRALAGLLETLTVPAGRLAGVKARSTYEDRYAPSDYRNRMSRVIRSELALRRRCTPSRPQEVRR